MEWFYRLMGTRTTTTLSFSPAALFAIRASFVAVHERPNVVHLYHYAEDIGTQLHEFFQNYEVEDRPPVEPTPLIYVKQTRPYQIGDVVIDVYNDVIYTVGTALGAHAVHQVVTSKQVNVYTSTKAYIEG
jgi:hypothetical protein